MLCDIDGVILSDDLLDRFYACDLSDCKGYCCVDGDSGAPLTEDEAQQIQKHYPIYKKYMCKEGKAAVKEQGHSVIDMDGDLVTPLTYPGGPCAYLFNEGGIYYCAIERAYRNQEIDFIKPLSCHMFPIIMEKDKHNRARLYFQYRGICANALSCGEKNNCRLYQSLKEPLIRAFGEEWYNELCAVAEEWHKQQKTK